MIIILKKGTSPDKVNEMINHFENMNFQVQEVRGVHETILGLIGDTSSLDTDDIKSMDTVAEVKRIQEPYKNANRKFHPDDTIVDVCGRKIGGGHFQVIAGPCSVESREQMISVANSVKASGAGLMRGGAFKPRTSPYSFQGLRAEGIEYLLEAKKASGLPIVTEIMSAAHLPLFEDVDVIQVGARNMQNFELLKELGKVNKPILLKRGLANTIEELLMSAESAPSKPLPETHWISRPFRSSKNSPTCRLSSTQAMLLVSAGWFSRFRWQLSQLVQTV